MSIDSLYEGVIAKLTKQGKIVEISKHLLSLKTNEERVLYVYDLVNETNHFPKFPDVHKSQNVSMYYRNHGNQCFHNSEDYKAWQYYNLALLHAPVKSDQYPLALSNRSAVFFSMEKYEECLKDIQTIFSMKHPGRLKEKLLKRETSCKEALEENNPDPKLWSEHLRMKNAKDPRYLCASTKLQVLFNEEMGRHVIAKEDIKVGEVLIQEDPYLVLLQKSQYLFSCSYCLSRDLNLLPCDKCCFTLYCSKECKEKALKEYHGAECTLMPVLIKMDFTKLELLALRTAIRARTDHPDWNALFKTIVEAEENAKTEIRGHVKINGKWVFDSSNYTSIHTLATNIEKRSVSDIFQKSVTAAVFLKLLTDKTDFMKSDSHEETENIRKCVAGLLLLHIMTSPTNMHGICSNMETRDGNFIDEVSLASASYAFHSLLNHSCAPNVVRFNELGTGKMSSIALRPIKKGQQLFDNYGSHHALGDRMSRHHQLKFQYKFDCICEACVNNWPTYLFIPHGKLPNLIKNQCDTLLTPLAIYKLQKGDITYAVKQYKPLCDLAEALEPYAPCKELADCQETLKQCLMIFAGCVPYGYSQLVEWSAIPPKV